MTDDPTQPTLPCAAADVPVERRSPHAIASLVVTGLSMAWLAVAVIDEHRLPFDIYKQWRIASVGAVLGVIFAFASYRQRSRHRWLSHIAMILSLLGMLFSLLVVPL